MSFSVSVQALSRVGKCYMVSDYGLQATHTHTLCGPYLEGEFANFFNDLSDAPNYDIVRTENSDVIGHFLLEILTFRECSTRVQHVSNMYWRHFEHSLNVNISRKERSINFLFQSK